MNFCALPGSDVEQERIEHVTRNDVPVRRQRVVQSVERNFA